MRVDDEPRLRFVQEAAAIRRQDMVDDEFFLKPASRILANRRVQMTYSKSRRLGLSLEERKELTERVYNDFFLAHAENSLRLCHTSTKLRELKIEAEQI